MLPQRRPERPARSRERLSDRTPGQDAPGADTGSEPRPSERYTGAAVDARTAHTGTGRGMRVPSERDGTDEDGVGASPAEAGGLNATTPAGAPLRAWEEADTSDSARERAVDHALIRRAQTGEEAAFAELVARHEARAWRVARNLVPTDDDAQDLAQEAFLRVFKNLAGFDFEHGFTTWLYRIVTNLAIDHLRKRRPAVSTAANSDDDDGGERELVDARAARPSDDLERAELGQEVRDVLATLAPHFQSVLMLREIEGLPCNEIAKIVGATHVTVRWRLHRGRKLFQEEWERRARWTDQAGPGNPAGGARNGRAQPVQDGDLDADSASDAEFDADAEDE